MRARYLLKTLALPAIHRSGGLWLLGRLFRPGGDVALNYHAVLPEIFERHAAFLAAHARTVSLDELLETPPRPTQRRVALTFDDGYAGFPREIVPILERHRLPAAWFVPTALVGSAEVSWLERLRLAALFSRRERLTWGGVVHSLTRWNRDYVASALCAAVKALDPSAQRPAAEALIGELGEAPEVERARLALVDPADFEALPAIITVGSHSHTHPQLSQQTDAQIRDELTTSRRLIEGWWGKPVRHFAFPSGDHDERVRRLVGETGYVSAWTTEARFRVPADDPLGMPRVPVDDRASLAVLAAKLTPALHRLGLA